ncbi:hypothetical protein KC622_01095 [Candidatus Dojkabacteria bacterium]|uniref:Lipoprotein n=1 Tax=Candidatus Dojkabacteria bacterium TaxID=2099670 RepID=A0A955HZ96_9BACT|nr:hypothetical protein [Candidatus Dojkabacteria bacterium]
MNKKVLVIAGIIGVLLVAAGGWFGYRTFIRPNRAFAEAREISKDINSAEFTFEQKMRIEYEFESYNKELDPINFATSGEGAFDIEKGDMYVKILLDLGELGNQEFTIYKIGDEAYATIGGQTSKIEKSELDQYVSSDSEGFNEGKVLQDLDDDAEYKLVGTEVIDGRDTFRYEVTLDGNALQEVLDSAVKDGLTSDSLTQYGVDFSDVEIKAGDTNYTVWVDQNTSEPVREYVSMDNLVYNFPGLFKMTVTSFTTQIEYQSVNKEVNIKAPLSI